MVDDSSDTDGPNIHIDWNFPMIRLLSASTQRVSSALNDVRGDSIPKRIKESAPKFRSNDSIEKAESDSNNRLSDLQNDIKNLRDGSPIGLGQDSGSSKIRYTGDVFVPLRTNVNVGEEIAVVNETSESITIESDNFSVDVSPNGESSLDIDSEGVHSINIEGVSESEVCGAIVVGDIDRDVELPCEDEVDREVFDDDADNNYSTSSKGTLSEVADNKDRSF